MIYSEYKEYKRFCRPYGTFCGDMRRTIAGYGHGWMGGIAGHTPSRGLVPPPVIHRPFQGRPVSPSLLEKTINYIRRQKEHHHKLRFEEEYKIFLEQCGIQYDEKYVFND